MTLPGIAYSLNLLDLHLRSFYLDPVYRLIPIFSPFSMAALLVSLICTLSLFHTNTEERGPPHSLQMFKIVAPFVILASVFATLNARLRLPPFSLFLVALTLTDGEWSMLPWLYGPLRFWMSFN